MDDIINKICTQVPDLIALIIIVIVFLKYLKGRDDMMKELNKENIDARTHSREVIERNTEAAIRNTNAVSEMAHIMQKIVESSGHYFSKK